MTYITFLKDKILSIILLIFSIITIEIFYMTQQVNTFIKIYTIVIPIISYIISITYEYIKKKKFYNEINNKLNNLEEKYLINEMLNYPNFIEGKLLINILNEIDKSMNENVNNYKYKEEDYKEYIELWIHEIKTPITTSKMIIENNKNKITKSIDEELDKMDNYIEQALYYARSNTVDKDYFIKDCILKDIVNESIKKNKTILIQNKVELNLHNLDNIVSTDNKWLIFILNQIIQNSIKYKDNNRKLNIEIYSKENKDNVTLYIKDNGKGINKSDLTRVFDKGFTGINGRKLNKKSTGIGLYLCKKLCNKLSINIDIESIEKEETTIKLIFPVSSYIKLK